MTDHRLTDRVRVFKDQAGEWRWRRRAANGETIAEGGEGYVDKHHALTMAAELNPGIAIQAEGEDDF